MKENEIATIFDIRRFSTHDGDGIRTNIFFKGCPLRCVWCQNPEGIDKNCYPIRFRNKCIGCGICLKNTVNNGVYLQDGEIQIRKTAQEDWTKIIEECPGNAIRFDARTYSVEELIKEVKRDMVFFRNSGGVTLSGGEPLVQGEFIFKLVKALKQEGVHIAIETALHVPLTTLQKVIPYIDQTFVDLKLIDRECHKAYTNVYSDRILENIEWLLRSEYRDKVIVRTPLIPEMTATEENIAGISKYISGLYQAVRYELLNYNPLAESKYPLVGRAYCFENNPPMYSKDEMKQWGEIASRNGIANLIMEI